MTRTLRLPPVLFILSLMLMLSADMIAQGVVVSDDASATPDASAMLEVEVTAAAKKGMLIPRMTASDRAAITSPATGLLVYQTDTPAGFYYYNGGWTRLGGSELTGSGTGGQVTFWSGAASQSGDAALYWDNTNKRLGLGTATPTEQLELTGNLRLPATTATSGALYLDTKPFLHAVNGYSTFLGLDAGNLSVTGWHNTAIGIDAGNALTGGSENVALGGSALTALQSGLHNTALGFYSMPATTASDNTAVGCRSMTHNTTGAKNVALGAYALFSNTTADENISIGYRSMYSSQTGARNVAIGYEALHDNSGNGNIAIGKSALTNNIGGTNNIAIGGSALVNNTTGGSNIALGADALVNANGSNNVALGYQAGRTAASATGNILIGRRTMYAATSATYNTVIGYEAGHSMSGAYNVAVGADAGYSLSGNRNTLMGKDVGENIAGDDNLVLGYQSGSAMTTGSNNICIDNSGAAAESNTIRIGDSQTSCYVQGIHGSTVTGSAVYVSSTGKLGVPSSPPLMGSGTANRLTYYSGTNTLAADNLLSWDPVNDRLGIGTTTPAYQLDLTGSIRLPATSGNNGIVYNGTYRFLHAAGSNNTFLGPDAGNTTLTSAVNNTGIGTQALSGLTIGDENTAVGSLALTSMQSSYGNTAVGYKTLNSVSVAANNTAVGSYALNACTGGGNIGIGSGAGGALTTGTNNICIDNAGNAGESNIIRIGDSQTSCYIKGIYGQFTVSGVGVLIGSNGKLGSPTSSRRYKYDIEDMSSTSDVLMKLRPVTFRYRSEHSEDQSLQYGLIAEEVAEHAPGLVLYNDDGTVETVFYRHVNAMLLNEVQKQHRRLAVLETENEQLRLQMQEIITEQKRLRDLMAGEDRDVRTVRQVDDQSVRGM